MACASAAGHVVLPPEDAGPGVVPRPYAASRRVARVLSGGLPTVGQDAGMGESIGGPRDHLANERTQLAWLRTGANVMVVGLAVARFGDGGEVTTPSLLAGGLLVVVGALGVGYGTLRYRRTAAELRVGTAAAASSSAGPAIAAGVLVVAVAVAVLVLLLGA
ncbi:DUF202 domain-containing protein [Aeromicrobium sp. IC_218]|nr:DUF202 domain-containing protein [Aeromicrobium sp. IC_218]